MQIAIKTTMFFDRSEVLQKLHSQKLKVFRAAGAFGMRVARNSIRQRPKKGLYTPVPGQPPRSRDRSNSNLRKGILFGYDARTDSVVIGPVHRAGMSHAHAIEAGGRAQIFANPGFKENQPKNRAKTPAQAASFARLIKAGRITLPPRQRRQKITVNFRPFPFMEPAREKTEPQFASLFAQLN